MPDSLRGMLGVHFAVAAESERELLAAADAGDVDAVGELLADLEENWPQPQLSVDTDKAWDEIHRCLTDGSLDPDGGEYPLSHAVLGGRHLHDEYYVVHVSATEVGDVAAALRDIDRAWLRRRFDTLDATEYGGPRDDTGFAYVWQNLVDLRDFYARAARSGRAVLFTAT